MGRSYLNREEQMIDFQRKQRVIWNALSGREYILVAVALIDPTERVIAQVTSICNEPLVHESLFRRILSGKPSPPSMAADWLARGADGWKKNSHFVFGIVDQEDRIAAACDIKSADASWAEVGYWSSASHSGVMTNAIVELIDLAREAGFEHLFAETQKTNVRSQGVLCRAGFALSDEKPLRENITSSFPSTPKPRTGRSTQRREAEAAFESVLDVLQIKRVRKTCALHKIVDSPHRNLLRCFAVASPSPTRALGGKGAEVMKMGFPAIAVTRP